MAAVAFALVAGQFGRLQYRRAVSFETQARMALAHERNARVENDLLIAKLKREHAETARAQRAVAVVDAENPPDTSCAPNLAARDAVITSQANEIETQGRSIGLLAASNAEMRRALEARPKLYPRFVGPNIGLGVFVGVVGVRSDGKPAYGAGIGVTVNVLGIRL